MHIDVISGLEEARLIHLGVLQAVPVFDRRLLLVDVGGGSTELLIGECGDTLAARSLKLGAVRLTDRFFPGGDVTPKAVKACRSYIRSLIEHFNRDVASHGFDVAVASSGSAETVARHADRTAEQIFGGIDAMKLRSSMTLFAEADPAQPVFAEVIATFFDGPDPLTLARTAERSG